MCTSVYCLRSALVCVIIYIYRLSLKAVGNMDSHYQIHTYIHTFIEHIPIWGFSVNKLDYKIKIHTIQYELYIFK